MKNRKSRSKALKIAVGLSGTENQLKPSLIFIHSDDDKYGKDFILIVDFFLCVQGWSLLL